MTDLSALSLEFQSEDCFDVLVCRSRQTGSIEVGWSRR